MNLRAHNPSTVPAAVGGYVNGLELQQHKRLLFISGQIPLTSEGVLPAGFEAQCEQVWANIGAVLKSADMDIGNLVKVTTFLSDRIYAKANREIRQRILGAHQPALTVIVSGIFDEAWLLEIEAIAASD